MCMMCEGRTHEDYVATVETAIAVHGWMAIGVGASERELPYVYTVGLEASFDHPELVAVGASSAVPAVVQRMAARVAEGLVIRPGDLLDTPGGLVQARAVHETRCAGPRFAVLHARAREEGVPTSQRVRPLQLAALAGDDPAYDPRAWRLDLPEPGPHGGGRRRR